MSERRLRLIGLAFQALDKTGDGVVTIEDLEMAYDPSMSPEVKSGKLSKADGLREFLKQFDTLDQDGIVTVEEFEEYYKNVSASIDDDDYFELMIRNAWHLSGGKGQYANTSNRRVMVTHADGRQSVEEIRDDLGIKATDEAGMRKRLKESGVDAVGKLGLTFGSDDTEKPKKARATGTVNPNNVGKGRRGESSVYLGWSGDTRKSSAKLGQSRQRERMIRTHAAKQLQSVWKGKKARNDVGGLRRRNRTDAAQQANLAAAAAKEKSRIRRPVGSNFY